MKFDPLDTDPKKHFLSVAVGPEDNASLRTAFDEGRENIGRANRACAGGEADLKRLMLEEKHKLPKD